MAERTERAVVNELIETCRDGARGFRDAAALVNDASLRALLASLGVEREQFAVELERHAQRLGGDAASAGTTGAALHRRWMELKSALTSHDDHAVMVEVRRGDGVTLRIYGEALAGSLDPSIRDVVEVQEKAVRDDHARIEQAMSGSRAHTLL